VFDCCCCFFSFKENKTDGCVWGSGPAESKRSTSRRRALKGLNKKDEKERRGNKMMMMMMKSANDPVALLSHPIQPTDQQAPYSGTKDPNKVDDYGFLAR
jgi:hypothetical protein